MADNSGLVRRLFSLYPFFVVLYFTFALMTFAGQTLLAFDANIVYIIYHNIYVAQYIVRIVLVIEARVFTKRVWPVHERHIGHTLPWIDFFDCASV